ncbi:MAG: hypothetical protein ACRCZA_00090, partial [Shewanella sp.]|uniref:hypothetical protein n=1 Tax=Shewanella sp. TaxID=50422 RepID=UPI003F38A908
MAIIHAGAINTPNQDNLALLADVQAFELKTSSALNRQLRGIIESGVYSGFIVTAGAGLNVVVSSPDESAAAVNVADKYLITVRQQHDVIIPVVAGVVNVIALTAFYDPSTITDQVDTSSSIKACEIKAYPQGSQPANCVVLAVITVPAAATQVTLDMVDLSSREGVSLEGFWNKLTDTIQQSKIQWVKSFAAGGFRPAEDKTGNAATDFIGTSAAWFKEGWFNSLRGGSIDVIGKVTSGGRDAVLVGDFGLGTASQELSEGADIRALPAINAKYRGQKLVNAPNATDWFYIDVTAHSSTFMTITATPFKSLNQYVCINNGGVWSPWAQLYTTENKPNKTDVGLPNVDNVRQYSASNNNIGTGATNYAAGNHNHSAISGNAATATKLLTPRAINGTNFDGSAAITTTLWGTARTLTIGNKANSVNGSGNVSWSLADIGALPVDANAVSATKLQTPRAINGVNFDGTAAITTTLWGTARTVTIGSTGKSVDGAANVSWSLAEIGALAVGANAVSATKLQTPRAINGTNFDGSAAITTSLWGTARTLTIGNKANSVNGSGNVSWSLADIGALAVGANAVSATKLQTPRAINGTNFDGSAAITTTLWGTARTLTIGNKANSVNGSGNVSWSLADIGAVNKAGDVMTGSLLNHTPSAALSMYRRVLAAGGGQFRTATASITGALEIRLPVSWTSTMLSFWIDVYNYATNQLSSFHVGGYNYSVNSAWSNCGAVQIGGRSLPVHFAHNGTVCTVLIGNADTVWSYPQVSVRDLQFGFSDGSTDRWNEGWDIGFVTDLGVISQTVASPMAYNIGTGATNYAAGNHNHSAISGNAATATKLQTPRAINGTNFDGSAAITTSLWGTARTLTIGNKANSVNGSGNVSWSLADIGAQPAGSYAAASHVHADATTSAAGFMSAADKSKLNAVASGANNYTHPTGDGNLHVPATGTTNSGKVLKAGATAGSLAWGTLTAADVGALASGGTAVAATKLATPRAINGVNFDGTAAITITAAANGGTSAACSGNAATATKLATPRAINGVNFDGTAAITI